MNPEKVGYSVLATLACVFFKYGKEKVPYEKCTHYPIHKKAGTNAPRLLRLRQQLEKIRNVLSPPVHRYMPAIVFVNSFIAIRQRAPSLRNRTSDVKSSAAHPYIAIFELVYQCPENFVMIYLMVCSSYRVDRHPKKETNKLTNK